MSSAVEHEPAPGRVVPVAPTDFSDLATRSSRASFVAAHPHLFLVGRLSFTRPQGPQATQAHDFASTPRTLPTAAILPEVREAARLHVLGVRKVQASFPSMITVGRTSNNDLVVPDVSVSRVHAFFRVLATGVELADAGSRNGTWIGWRQVPPKGAGTLVTPGATVRFGKVEFTVHDAGSCWDALQRDRK